MPGRIVVFGATGYTGRLTAEALVAAGAVPMLAGRSEERLRELSELLGGADWRVADVARLESVSELVDPGDVLVSTVGPFVEWGEPAVRAAIAAGVPYIDSTGEPPFIRRVFTEWGEPAARSGATLLTAMGYDFVPGALAGALALREAGAAAVRVDVGYYALGGGPSSLSRGTRATSAGIALSPAYAYRGGRIRTVRSAERMRSFSIKGKERPAISIGGSEHFALPRTFPQLREVNVYLGWFGALARGMQLTSRLTSLAGRIPGAQRGAIAAGRKLAARGEAPAPGTTPGALAWIAAVAYDEAGEQLAEVQVNGADPYAFTAAIMAWAAQQALEGAVRVTGAAGPVEAFGLDELEAGCASVGLTRVAAGS